MSVLLQEVQKPADSSYSATGAGEDAGETDPPARVPSIQGGGATAEEGGGGEARQTEGGSDAYVREDAGKQMNMLERMLLNVVNEVDGTNISK